MISPLLALPKRCAALLAATLSLHAFAAPAKFDIPGQELPSALQLFIKQSGSQVMFVEDEVKSSKGNAVKGEHEPSAAIGLLLKGTGFAATERQSGWFAVVRESSEKPGSIEGQVRDESGRPVPNARVTLSGSDMEVTTDRRGRFLFEDVPAGAQALAILAEGMQRTKVTDVVVRSNHRHTLGAITVPAVVPGITQLEDYIVSAKKNDGVVELDAYEVRAKREEPFSGASIDIQRTRDDVLPFATFTGEEIRLSGAVDVQEFLRERVTQNFAGQDFSSEIPGLSNLTNNYVNQFNMRGWGSNEVVVLVNGRRLAKQSVFSLSAPVLGDYSGIPVSSIERVEVLTSAGSAIYGEGATGGVLNIITKRDYRGGSVSLSYENSTNGYAPKRSFELNYAQPLIRGFNLRVGFNYRDSKPLNLEDRADVITDRWRSVVSERSPQTITGPTAGFLLLGATTNISTFGFDPLFGPGTATFTSVPAGYAGGQELAPFMSRQGVYNLELSNAYGDRSGFFGGKQILLGSNLERKGYTIGLDKALSPNWQLAVDYTRSEQEQWSPRGGTESLGTLTVHSGAPSNPFGVFASVTFYDPRYDQYSDTLANSFETKSDELVATLRGEHGEWRSILDLAYGHYLNRSYVGDLIGSYINNTLRVFTGGTSQTNVFRAGLYNPFVDMRTIAPADPTFYENYVYRRTVDRSGTDSWQGAFKISGPIVDLPAGSARLTSGLEWQRHDRNFNRRESDTVRGNSGQILTSTPQGADVNLFVIDTYSVYGEFEAPLLASSENGRYSQRLELFGSGRASRDLRDGKSTNLATKYESDSYIYAAGLRYGFLDAVDLRASYSVGFRAPAFGEIVPALPATTNITVTDVRRNNQPRVLDPSMRVSGGNPEIDPEETNSTNIGIVFKPKSLPIRFSADYVESIRNNAITSIDAQGIINLEADSAIGARIQRAAPESGAPNGVGVITFVDARAINLSEISSRSIDFTLEYQHDRILNGRLSLSLGASKNISFKVQPSANSPALEQVRQRQPASPSQALRWNANGMLRWQGRQWQFGWTARYYDSILAPQSDFAILAGDRIPGAVEHDVMASYKLPSPTEKAWGWILAETSVNLGVKNIFDREPRFRAGSPLPATPDGLYGRSVWLQLRRDF